jgi:alcohol dehydrogenase
VRTVAGAISIGSELPVYRGDARSAVAPVYPRMTGYESFGVVEACGERVGRFRAGDRVVAFYGHRSHALVAEGKAIAVPAGIGPAVALPVILSCDVAKGIRRVAPAYDEAVLVTGAGAIGVLTVCVLRAIGVHTVDVIEPRRERHALAQRLGARRVLTPQEARAGEGYTAGFECSSTEAGFGLLQSQLKPHGRICILADGNIEPLTLTPAFHAKELSVAASSDGWDYHRHAAWYFNLVGSGPHPIEGVFEHRVPAAEMPAAFEQMAQGRIAPVKVLVDYV